MPSKTYTMMAAGAAILGVGPEDSELADVVRDFACGLHVRPKDPGALAAAIRRLHANRGELEAMKLAARRAAEEHFSRPTAGARYVEFIRRAFGWE